MKRPRKAGLLTAAFSGLATGLLARLLQLSGPALLAVWALAVLAVVVLIAPRVVAALAPRRPDPSPQIFAPLPFHRTRIWHQKQLIWRRSEYFANYTSRREFEWQDSTYERPRSQLDVPSDKPDWAISLPDDKALVGESRP